MRFNILRINKTKQNWVENLKNGNEKLAQQVNDLNVVVSKDLSSYCYASKGKHLTSMALGSRKIMLLHLYNKICLGQDLESNSHKR